ncbi:unnamed protein product [Leuciscus chuanchicus]
MAVPTLSLAITLNNLTSLAKRPPSAVGAGSAAGEKKEARKSFCASKCTAQIHDISILNTVDPDTTRPAVSLILRTGR